MNTEEFADILKKIGEMHVKLMENCNRVLEENVRLWKENSELKIRQKTNGN